MHIHGMTFKFLQTTILLQNLDEICFCFKMWKKMYLRLHVKLMILYNIVILKRRIKSIVLSLRGATVWTSINRLNFHLQGIQSKELIRQLLYNCGFWIKLVFPCISFNLYNARATICKFCSIGGNNGVDGISFLHVTFEIFIKIIHEQGWDAK